MTRQPEFSVNGRFLARPVTGVQRYARNVITAISAAIGDSKTAIPVFAPRKTPDPALRAMPLIETGRLTGHAWEQAELPNACKGALLSLCNIGPLASTEQTICIHDANVFEAGDSYDFRFRMLYRLLQPLLVKRAVRICTVSAYSAKRIAHWLPVEARDICVLPNGHEHALSWSPDRARTAPDLFSGDAALEPGCFILVLGSQAPHKNMSLVLKLAPALGEAGLKVVIVGSGASIFARTQAEAAANVVFTGRVDDDDLAFLLDRALCLVFPSWTEGFGLPILEAMARGCPVVSSNRASMPEICENAALLAAPDEPAEWLAQLNRLRGSKQLREELAGRGKQRLPAYSWASTGRGYLDLMQTFARAGV